MYKIIGADGREYGPVTSDQLREWIASNRANALTRAQAEGDTDWKPLSAFPEFAATFAAKPTPLLAGPPPEVNGLNPEALANEILQRDFALDVTGCIGRAWDLVKQDFWPIVGVTGLIFILLIVVNHAFLGLVLSGPLMGGLYAYGLKKIRGQPCELKDAFSGFTENVLQTMLACLVVSLLAAVGIAFCILPGIYLGVAWKLTLPLVMDKRLQFWDAMEVSRKVVTRHWWSFFGLVLLLALLNLGGVLLLCVGLFVTVPVSTFAILYAYEDIFGSGRTQAA